MALAAVTAYTVHRSRDIQPVDSQRPLPNEQQTRQRQARRPQFDTVTISETARHLVAAREAAEETGESRAEASTEKNTGNE